MLVSAWVYAADTTPPSAISNLTALTDTSHEGGVILKWTAPYDNVSVNSYILKYATNQITDLNDFYASWTLTYSQQWQPEAGGTPEEKQIEGFRSRRDSGRKTN